MKPLRSLRNLPPIWSMLGLQNLPFADAASTELPIGRLLRLSLFQVSVGMAAVLLVGTLNRVMIVELGVPATLVGLMVALPIVFAPLRAFIGHRSDHHKSFLGWRRVPYIWIGTSLQYAGLSIMPFAVILLSGDTTGPLWIGYVAAALAFLLTGAGMHTVQTVGLALATDLAPPHTQPKVVALLSVMMLIGMMISAIGFGLFLTPFSQVRLVQVIQGAALLTLVMNLTALWKQEARNPSRTRSDTPTPRFQDEFRALLAEPGWLRLFVALALGAAGFSMQDLLLEPYGGQVLHLGVGATTLLTALFAAGAVAGFVVAARIEARGGEPLRIAAWGGIAGTAGFTLVLFAAPLQSTALFAAATIGIGFGSGQFTVAMLSACMQRARGSDRAGLVLGAYGAVQATAAGLAIASGGLLRDTISDLGMSGALGPMLADASVGYGFVYLLEILLLFAMLVAIGPLTRHPQPHLRQPLGTAGQTLNPKPREVMP